MTEHLEHTLAWNDRLLDWLDGDGDAAERTQVEAHVAGCTICREQLEAFQAVDRQLAAATPRLALDASFDKQLFARIDNLNDGARAEARRHLELEQQNALAALSRRWRQTLVLTISGIIAGIAIAFAFAGYLNASGATHALVQAGANEIGQRGSDMIPMVLTGVLGALIGGAVSRWLVSLSD